MFDNLTQRLTQTFQSLRGRRLTEENMQQAIRDVRMSLLEADVALPVIKNFIEQVKQKALGQNVLANLEPDQALIKIVHDELVCILGTDRAELNFKTQPPAVFLLAGLQGSGKTTSAAKLARYLQETEKKKVMLASVDVYRPAAIKQLERLATELNVTFFETNPNDLPVNIARLALSAAKKQFIDVLILDTAGRLHVDTEMMDEIKSLHAAVHPIETLFVIDSMTGQDAANTAKAFHDTIALTGIILTKTDGDARGGAALSVTQITGQPIKFIGHGEKVDALEVFHPDRIASRILGMGDMLSLIEEVERKTDKAAHEKLTKKIKKGKSFDLEDFKQQLIQMNTMGGISGLLSKLPGMSQLPQQTKSKVSDKSFIQTVAIINSMTPKERRVPKIVIGSRKKRIAAGAGVTIQEVNKLLSQFEKMQKMLKKFSKPGGMTQMMRGMKGMPGMSNIFPGKGS